MIRLNFPTLALVLALALVAGCALGAIIVRYL